MKEKKNTQLADTTKKVTTHVNSLTKKIVKPKRQVTKSGITSCNSEDRTIKLCHLSAERSAHFKRAVEKSGLKKIQDISEATGLSPGVIGRTQRADSCPSNSKCFQSGYGFWRNKNGNKLYMSSRYIVGKGSEEPVVVKNDVVNSSDLLREMLSKYDGSFCGKLPGLIPIENRGDEKYDKMALSLFVSLDLFIARHSNGFIAFVNDDIIAGCVEADDVKSLNGKRCVIWLTQESSPVIRTVHLIDGFLLCSADSNDQEGTFILPMNQKFYKIGKIVLTFYEEHREIMDTVMQLEEQKRSDFSQFDTKKQTTTDEEEIFFINTKN